MRHSFLHCFFFPSFEMLPMCFYVGIVLPPSFFLHHVIFVLNKLYFGPQTILFLKMRPSIYSLDNGVVNLHDIDLCLF